MWSVQIDFLLAAGVLLATAATDAAYVMFTSAVVTRRRLPAATWSGIWYLLSSFAVISYTNNWTLRGSRFMAWSIPDYHLPPPRPPPLGPVAQ